MTQNSMIIYTIHFIASSIISWYFGTKPLEFSFSGTTTDFPTSDQLLNEFVGAILIFEFLLYTGHHLMHHRRFYNIVHEHHHYFEQEQSEQVPFVVFYARPVEAVFVYTSLPPCSVVMLLVCGYRGRSLLSLRCICIQGRILLVLCRVIIIVFMRCWSGFLGLCMPPGSFQLSCLRDGLSAGNLNIF